MAESSSPLDAFDPADRPVWGIRIAKIAMRAFYREIEVVGVEKVPTDRPLLVVANHFNSLIDPALLLACVPVGSRFLAKSTLWDLPYLRPFLKMTASIPVFRRHDPGVDASQNELTFRACHDVLRHGGSIALFPEGISHNEPALVELKTGAARIVLEAEKKYDDLGTHILPVGLTFDAKGTFRSRALVTIGDALDPGPEIDLMDDEPREAARALTDRIYDALEDVTLNFPSWEEADLIRRAAQIWARPDDELPAERSLEDRFSVQKAFIEGYEQLKEEVPEQIEEAIESVREYDAMLDEMRLQDAQVASSYPPGRVALFTLKSLWLLFVRWPLAVVGTIIHWPAYRLAGVVAGERTADVLSTYKLMTSILLMPLTWILTATAAGFFADDWRVGLAALVVVPITGVVALRFHERRRFFRRQARAFLLLRSGKGSVEELRRRRAEVLRCVQGLAERL